MKLHVSYEELTVYYKSNVGIVLNKRLLDNQNAWSNLDAIKDAHWLKLMVYEMLEETSDRDTLKSLGNDLTEIEFELQDLWGFPLDANYHRFWEYPKCTCPKMDNADWYPHRSVIQKDCPLHG